MTGHATPPELPPGLLEEYLAGMRPVLTALAGLAERLAVARNDVAALEALRREVHKIHGSAGSFGFMEVSRLAAGMEATVKDWISWPGDPEVDRGSLTRWFVARLAEMLGLEVPPPAPAAPRPRVGPPPRPSQATTRPTQPPLQSPPPPVRPPGTGPRPSDRPPATPPPPAAPRAPLQPPKQPPAPAAAPTRPAPPSPRAPAGGPKVTPAPPPPVPAKPKAEPPARSPAKADLPWILPPDAANAEPPAPAVARPPPAPPKPAPAPSAPPAPAQPVAARAPAPDVPRAVAPSAPAGDVPEIVFVEDDAALAELLAYGLSTRGYRFVAYRNGREALKELLALDVRGTHPLLLLDVDLPALDGYSILDALQRARPGTYRVVFTTVHGTEEEQLRGLEAGALDYLVKPISLRVALEKIKRWVGR